MSAGYALKCRRCGKCIFCTSLRKGRKELEEHWNKRHWNFMVDFSANEYEVDKFIETDWDLIRDSIGTPEFNRALYHS